MAQLRTAPPITILTITLLTFVSLAGAQDHGDSDRQAAAMAALSAYATPSVHHKALAARVGTWDASITFWATPDAEADESTGNSDFTMIMEGRYLMENFTSPSPMGVFSGMGLTGYDNMKQRYVSVWIDSMSTGVMVAESSKISAKKVEYRGEAPDPVSGTIIEVRTVENRIDEDTYRFETWIPDSDGNEFKNMEILYKRK